MGATYFLKPSHVVAKPMLAPVAWGDSAYGGDTTVSNNEDITGVIQVSCGGNACAGLKTDGSVVAWGDSNRGGDVQGQDVTGVVHIDCGYNACVGLKTDGSVVAWGNSCCGGDVQGKDVTGMTQAVCGDNACAGLKSDGSVVAWGRSDRGGDVQGKDVTSVAQVVCGGYACAGLKTDGLVVAWGDYRGGDVQGKDVTGIAQVVCGGYACAGLKMDGSVVTWGDSIRGGDVQGQDVTGMAQVVCSWNACAGLKIDGSVVAWGASDRGGDVQGKDVTNVTQLACGRHACAGLKTDGSVVVWGDSANGGDVQGNDVTGVAKVVCGRFACAGLKIDGSVVAWGDSAKGGDIQGELIVGANQISCGGFACAAWYDPDTAGGGGDPHFIAFGGIYFTWQGHCDLVMVKSTKYIDGNSHFEVHIRTTRIRKWSKIDRIAIKVGQDVGEISSQDGMFILNGLETNTVQKQELIVVKSVKKVFSRLGKVIYLYDITIHRDMKLQVEVNTRTCMIYTKLSGNYPQHTEGILGSPHQTGLLSRNGKYIPITNVNAFTETWQVGDMDSYLFSTDRAPQFPSRCLYDIKPTTTSRFNRHLKELHTVPEADAIAACAAHHPGPLQKFCVDDVVMSGDLDSAKAEFYE